MLCLWRMEAEKQSRGAPFAVLNMTRARVCGPSPYLLNKTARAATAIQSVAKNNKAVL